MATKKRPTYVATITGLSAKSMGDLYELAEICGGVIETVAHEHDEATNGATPRTRTGVVVRYPDKVLLLPGRASPNGARALVIHQHLIVVTKKLDGPINRRDLNTYLDGKGVKPSSYSPAISIMIREGSIKVVEPKQPKSTAKTRVRGDQPNK